MEKPSIETEKANKNISLKSIRELIGQNIWLNNTTVLLSYKMNIVVRQKFIHYSKHIDELSSYRYYLNITYLQTYSN